MRISTGVVVVLRLTLFSALSVGCVTESEKPAAERQALLGACSKDSQCEDGNPCTQNACAVGLCLAALPVLGCCYEGDCTSNGDGAVAPLIELPPLACSTDEECEDRHPCTRNLCVVGACAALPVLGCCLDGDCSVGLGGSSAGGSGTNGGTTNGGTTNGGTTNGAAANGAAANGAAADAGAAAGGDGPSLAGSAGLGGSSGMGAVGATDAGAAGDESGLAGTAASNAQSDYRLQGGGCTVGSAPRSASYVSIIAALATAAGWLRRRHRPRSAAASLRHS
jgi:hypothetical protein